MTTESATPALRATIAFAVAACFAGCSGGDAPPAAATSPSPKITSVLASNGLPTALTPERHGRLGSVPLIDLETAPSLPVGMPTSLAPKAATLAGRTFHLAIAQLRYTLVLPSAPGAANGSVTAPTGAVSAIDSADGPDDQGRLSVHLTLDGKPSWLRARVVDGVLVGRWAPGALADTPSKLDYQGHATGWNQGFFDQGTARVFDVATSGGHRATLRLDRRADGTPFGRWKTYSSVTNGTVDEGPEVDLAIDKWEGDNLVFQVDEDGDPRDCVATITGRTLDGTCVYAGVVSWITGDRAELLTYGLVPRDPDDRLSYQHRTRGALRALMMAGDPTPTAITVESLGEVKPPSSGAPPPDRDDDLDSHAADYVRRELVMHVTYADPYGGPDVVRDVHGWLAVPTGVPPAGGFPAVVALNGHAGSAYRVLDPTSETYWFGDAYARRGKVVLAVDISHRPLADRDDLYGDYDGGDEPGVGNGPHPAIRSAGFDADWEEDGERVADARLARTLLAQLDYVDASRVLVTGISLGAEVTTYAAALDAGFVGAVSAGFSPDLYVLALHGNHECWRWRHADVREYLGVSDLHALIAPRPLLVETGKTDGLFSSLPVPFGSDKQVMRRSRVAYGADASAIAHYLHYDVHHYHVGDVDPTKVVEAGVRVPVAMDADPAGSTDWQTNGDTWAAYPTLFAWLDGKAWASVVPLAPYSCRDRVHCSPSDVPDTNRSEAPRAASHVGTLRCVRR